MERRSFLKAVGVGATLGTAATACLPNVLAPRKISDTEMQKIFEQMDGGLAKISTYDMVDEFVKGGKTTNADRVLSRKSLRALYSSQMFRGMPEEVQMHPEMQARMYSQLGEMDEAVFGMTDMLSSLPHGRREAVRHQLQKRPEVPEQISEGIDRRAGNLKLAFTRRLQMRSIFAQMGWRLRNQSPSVVIDEYVKKVEKVSSQVGSQAELERRIAARMGGAYWRYQSHLALADDPGNQGGGAPGVPGPVPTVGPATPVVQPHDPTVEELTKTARMSARSGDCKTVLVLGDRVRALDPDYYFGVFAVDPSITGCAAGVRPAPPPGWAPLPAPTTPKGRTTGEKVVGAGGWMLGIGLLTGLGAAAVLGISNNNDTGIGIGLVGLTVGALLLIGGLIVLIIGAIIEASE